MAIVITLDSTFNHLNGDRTLSVKQNSTSVEKEAICNIAIGNAAGDKYVTNGITLDFSKVRKFKKVYVCDVIHQDIGRVMTFVPAADNDSATGKLKIWDTDGNELSNDNTLTQNKNLRVLIRGR